MIENGSYWNGESIRDECKKERAKQKKTYEQIAKESGVSLGTINRFFGNERNDFRPSTVNLIAETLGINVMSKDIAHSSVVSNPDVIAILQGGIIEKKQEIESLKEKVERLTAAHKDEISQLNLEHKREREEIRTESAAKIEHLKDELASVKKDKATWRWLCIGLFALVLLLVLIDFFIQDKGWIQKNIAEILEVGQDAMIRLLTLFGVNY